MSDKKEQDVTLDADVIKEKILSDHNISRLVEEGTKLLERTEQPNIITLAQFEPFIPLFNCDNEKLDKESSDYDREYDKNIRILYDRYVHGLGINLYQPTIVILSKEDPQELYFLNRAFTRIKSDVLNGKSNRDAIPAVIPKSSDTTRDTVMMEASIADLVDANNTPAQKEYFQRVRIDSAIIQKKFVDNNLSPEKRDALLQGEDISSGEISNTGTISFSLDDDD